MPGYADQLDRKQIWSIVAYIPQPGARRQDAGEGEHR